ncbi:organic cation/carnitine transporter 2-like isoform X1 [Phycodurus eques]|uniref:organic cation/carnitine transporter 2-like isoform X1 n=1 Tax=Phycodurus eques TaxID=693459 RepID=UPI002ACD97ED|nr:organic cation/carnitine transporter 2-like isoform X1 [Phycodurus eques]
MSSETCKDFDRAMAFLGEYGRFQILIMVLLSLTAVPCGYMGVLAVFVADTPAHRCRTWLNSTLRDPHGVDSGPDSCYRYKVDTNRSEPGEPSNGTDRCVDGWLFSTESYTIVSEWGLVCENAWKVPFSTSMFFVGVLFGSLVGGQLSDRFGRKRVLFFTIALQSVTTLIQATSVNWVMFCALNCLRGVGQVSTYISSLILGSEMLCESARITYSLLGQCLAFSIGYALLPLFAYFIRGWRLLLVASAIPGLLFIPTWRVIPESPRWLLQRGRVKEADMVMRQAAKMNRIQASEIMFSPGEGTELVQKPREDKQMYTFMDLISSANLRNITGLGVFIWLTITLVFYGLSLNTSNLKGNIYLNCLVSAATDTVANVSTWLLIRRVPRPALLFLTLMFSGITLLVVKIVPGGLYFILTLCNPFDDIILFAKLGVVCSFCLLFFCRHEYHISGFGSRREVRCVCGLQLYLCVFHRAVPHRGQEHRLGYFVHSRMHRHHRLSLCHLHRDLQQDSPLYYFWFSQHHSCYFEFVASRHKKLQIS